MALNIRDSKTERETKPEAVPQVLRDASPACVVSKPARRLADELDEIALHCARLPVLDARTPDEILGYEEHGTPR